VLRVPYVSKAEKAAREWVFVKAVCKRVRAAECCGPREAQRQIRSALADGELRPRWGDIRPRATLSRHAIWDHAGPGPWGKHWKDIYVDWKSSKTIDPTRAASLKKLDEKPTSAEMLRTFKIFWPDVERLWPLADKTANAGPVAPNGKRKTGPKKGQLARFADADRALFPEIQRRMREKKLSVSAAALELAHERKAKGSGTVFSNATRLARLYRTEYADRNTC
jgi:hypothetical protein